MIWLIRYLRPFLLPLTRPMTRLLVSIFAIPFFRFLIKKIFRVKELGEEFEKDIEQWFRGTLLLLFATRNMESIILGYVKVIDVYFNGVQEENALTNLNTPGGWLFTGLRLLLAIGVIESMPDQELFAIVHPGPPHPKFSRKNFWATLKPQVKPIVKGLLCMHLNRSSPVFAIMATIIPGRVGWICFSLAIVQYLIIGLVTSRDQALEVLTQFDLDVARRRKELITEFDINEEKSPLPEQSESCLDSEPIDIPDPGQQSE
jgi:hypothetical protein